MKPTLDEIKFDILSDIYMAGVNMSGEYQGCWTRFKDIETIVNEHFKKAVEVYEADN